MTNELLGSLELNRIYQMDCLEGMRLIPDDSVDLIVIDPPYNIGKDKRWDKWDTVEEYIDWMAEVFLECDRILNPKGSFYWWHNDMAQIRALMDALDNSTSFIFKQFITWDKYNGSKWNQLNAIVHAESNRNYPKQAEYCLYYTFDGETGLTKIYADKGNFREIREYLWRQKEIAKLTNKDINALFGTATNGSGMAGHYFSKTNVQWKIPTEEHWNTLQTTGHFSKPYEELRQEYESMRLSYESQRYTFNNNALPSVWLHEPVTQNGHITPKPVPLMENIVRTSSNRGDVVLDCFMGSGTTAVAAARLNRKFIGFEREQEYIEIANIRIDSVKEAEA